MIKKSSVFICLWIYICVVQVAFAALTLNTTRVLFEATEKEKLIKVTNNDSFPVLAQSWISKDGKRNTDFLITPPLFRLEPTYTGDIRIVKMSQNVPEDRESLYWINVKGVQPNDPNPQNTLSFAINTQIKMFYRPESLINKEKADSAYKQLMFSLINKDLIVKNPTPYYVIITQIRLGNEVLPIKSGYISPFSEIKLPIRNSISKYEVNWNATSPDGEVFPQQTKPVR